LLKFTPELNLVKTSSKGEKNMKKPVSVERLPLPIPAKSSKEVNKISKFFKKNNYAQVSHSLNNIRKVLKIKIFLNL